MTKTPKPTQTKATNQANPALSINLKIKKAFSLIELLFVIMMLGFLLAGISKGIDLYRDMKLSAARSYTTNSPVTGIEGLTLWFETTSEKSFSKIPPSDNSLIGVWNDINPQRTQKFNASQNVDANKPYYISQGINGLPALKFSAGIRQLQTISLSALDFVSYNQATIFIVHNNFNSNDSSSQFKWWTSGTTRISFHATWNNKIIYWDFGPCCGFDGRLYSSPLTTFGGKNKILTFTKNANNLEIRVNKNETLVSSSVATATVSNAYTAPIIIGGSSYIGEVIVFNRALTSEERIAVEEYLSKKWGIKLT